MASKLAVAAEVLEDRALLATFVIDDDGTGDFTTVQAAIDDAGTVAGDVLQITGGADRTHTEPGIVINKDLIIEGTPGAMQVIIQADPQPGIANARVFTVPIDTTVTISDLIVQHGHLESVFLGDNIDDAGGGIYNAGVLTIRDSVVRFNEAAQGGGLVNDRDLDATILATLIVENTIIQENTAQFDGGGISNQLAILEIRNSAISQNRAMSAFGEGGGLDSFSGTIAIESSLIDGNFAGEDGGGIFLSGDTATVASSTITNNSAQNLGGGIFLSEDSIVNDGTVEVVNSTIIGNTAEFGGGLLNLVTTLDAATVQNTIVADNVGGDLVGRFTGTNNAVKDGSGIGLINTITGDPLLGPLQDNGGPTFTYAPLDNSPILNAGDDNSAVNSTGADLMTDQRGEPRFIGTVDIGAVESINVSLQTGSQSLPEDSDMFSFEVRLQGNPSETVTVEYVVTGENIEAADFVGNVLPTGVVTFLPGVTTQTVSLAIFDDNRLEADETFIVSLVNASGDAVIAPGNAEFTIEDNDIATLSLVANNSTQQEGSAGIDQRTSFTFSVILDNPVDGGLTVNFSTIDGTATVANQDYQATTGTLAFAGNAGETQILAVPVSHDERVEPEEFFRVMLDSIGNLSSGIDAASVTIADGTEDGVIQNDDIATVILAGVNTSQLEGAGGMTTAFTFSVTVDNEIDGGLQVEYETNDGPIIPNPNLISAVEGDDYQDNDGTLTFLGNTASDRQFITVLVNNDDVVENTELFHVLLNSVIPTGAGITADSVRLSPLIDDRQQQAAILNILENDPDNIGEDTSQISIEFLGFTSEVNDTDPNNPIEEQFAEFQITSANPVQGGFTLPLSASTNTDGNSSVGAFIQPSSQFLSTFAGGRLETQTIRVQFDPLADTISVLAQGSAIFLPPSGSAIAVTSDSSERNVRPEDILLPNGPTLTTLPDIDITVLSLGAGNSPLVSIFNADPFNQNPPKLAEFLAYDVLFRGGIQVAVADVNGDGTTDIITGPGAGGGPHIKVFSGASGTILSQFFAFDPQLTQGVDITATDFTGDGRAEIVVALNGDVRIFDVSQSTENPVRAFSPYIDVGFTGKVQLTTGNVTGDATPEIITAPGSQGGPIVRFFDFNNPSAHLLQFAAYNAAFDGGLFLATGQLDFDPALEIVTGPNAGGGPVVRVFDADDLFVRGLVTNDLEFGAYVGTQTSGVRLTTVDLNNDGIFEIVTTTGPGVPTDTRIFNVSSRDVTQFPRGIITPFPEPLSTGVFLAGFNRRPNLLQTSRVSTSTFDSPTTESVPLFWDDRQSENEFLKQEKIPEDLVSIPGRTVEITNSDTEKRNQTDSLEILDQEPIIPPNESTDQKSIDAYFAEALLSDLLME